MRLEEEQQQKRVTQWPLGLRSPLLWPLLAAAGGTIGWGSSTPLLSLIPACTGFLWLTLSSSRSFGKAAIRQAVILLFATGIGIMLRKQAEDGLPEPHLATWIPSCQCITYAPSDEIWPGRWATEGLCIIPGFSSPLPVLIYTPRLISGQSGLYGFARWMPFSEREDFNERAWRRSSGLSSAIEFEDFETWSPESPWIRPATGIRHWLTRFYTSQFSPQVAGFLLGISTGDKSLLPEDWKRAFQMAGLSHLLAVSGYHVGLVGFLSILLGRSRRSWHRWASLILLPAVWGFIWICGFPVSAVRSGVMVSAWVVAQTARRPISGLQSWSLAGWSLLLFNPLALTSLGAQLSFLAVLSIFIGVLALAPWLRRIRRRSVRWGFGLLVVPLIAQIGTSPLTLPAFGMFPTAFLPLNLCASPVMTLTGLSIACILILQGTGFPTEWLTTMMDEALKACGDFLLAWSDHPLAALEGGHLNPWGWAFLTSAVLLALLGIVAPRGRSQILIVRSSIAILCTAPWFLGTTSLSPQNHVIWVDASTPTGLFATSARTVSCYSFSQRDLNKCKVCAKQRGLKMEKALLMGRLSYRSGLIKVGDSILTIHWQPDGSVEVEELGEGLVYIPLPFRNVRNRQDGIHPVVPP